MKHCIVERDACWPTVASDGYGIVIGPHSPLMLYAGYDPETCMQAEQDRTGYWINGRRADGVYDSTGLEDAESDDSPSCVCCHGFVSRWVSN